MLICALAPDGIKVGESFTESNCLLACRIAESAFAIKRDCKGIWLADHVSLFDAA
jgi:hypothetical protein